MKKRWFAALLALALLCCATSAVGEAEGLRTAVLVYISGSDLESEDASATADIIEMMRAGLPEDGPVTVLVEAGGSKRWHASDLPDRETSLLQVTNGGQHLLESQGKRNMGDESTLAGFLEYARENFPADRYLLVLWGHGDGPTGGVCFDDLHRDDSLMLDELASALEGATQAGQNIEAVIFDACMMNCADLLAYLSPYTNYIVSSQESTLGSGGRYDLWLGALAAAPDADALEICNRFAETYIGTASHGVFSQAATISVLDASQADAVQRAVEALYARLDALLDAQPEALRAAVLGLTSFGELDGSPPSGLVDAAQLCDALQDLAPEECDALRAAVQQAVRFNGASGSSQGETCGLSLFLPCAEQPWPYALDWYRPLADESSYARLIVRLAEQLEPGRAATIIGALREVILGYDSSSQSAPVVDVDHIWQGLDAQAGSASSAQGAAFSSSAQGAPAVDVDHIWQGLGAEGVQ